MGRHTHTDTVSTLVIYSVCGMQLLRFTAFSRCNFLMNFSAEGYQNHKNGSGGGKERNLSWLFSPSQWKAPSAVKPATGKVVTHSRYENRWKKLGAESTRNGRVLVFQSWWSPARLFNVTRYIKAVTCERMGVRVRKSTLFEPGIAVGNVGAGSSLGFFLALPVFGSVAKVFAHLRVSATTLEQSYGLWDFRHFKLAGSRSGQSWCWEKGVDLLSVYLCTFGE